MYELKPHQRKAVDRLSNGKILYGDMGSGKSFAAATYYMEKEAPKDVYVITTAKKRNSLDWEGEFIHFGVGVGTSTAGKLKVDSWNNISKYVDVKDAFFIFDEQRLVGSGAWTKHFLKIVKANTWILLTATPGDNWLDYIPVFLANGFYKNRTAFKLEHVVYNNFGPYPKVERYLSVGKLIRYRTQLLVEMPMERHTTRIIKTVRTQYDIEDYKKVSEKRWNIYTDRPVRNVSERFAAMRRVVYSDPSRLDALRGLMEKHPRLIVFYNFDYELEILRSLTTIGTSTRSHSSRRIDSERSPIKKAIGDSRNSSSSEATKKKLNGECERSPEKNSPGTPETVRTESKWHTSNGISITTSPSTLETTSKWSEQESKKRISEPSSRRVSGPSIRSSQKTIDDGPMTAPSEEKLSPGTPPTSSTVQIAEWNGHKHEEIPKQRQWIYLVQYTAGSESWNCIETNAVVFFSLTYSYKSFYQAHGRIDRMNTPYKDLYYYYFLSEAPIDRAVLKSLKNKESFNERESGL